MGTSRWGADDQRGAANEITPTAVLQALQAGTNGTVLDLAQPVWRGSPRDSEQSPYTICMWSHPVASRHDHAFAGAHNDVGFAVERVELDLHTGTHIDALGHCVVGDRMYNDVLVDEAVTNQGLGTRWLVEQRVAAVGSDTFAFEVWPPEDPHVQWPVHQELLVRAGVYIIEQARLDEAAQVERYEFLCLCLPVRFVGGTASPIRLTAVL
jgi:kynurenine formamidase